RYLGEYPALRFTPDMPLFGHPRRPGYLAASDNSKLFKVAFKRAGLSAHCSRRESTGAGCNRMQPPVARKPLSSGLSRVGAATNVCQSRATSIEAGPRSSARGDRDQKSRTNTEASAVSVR